jgi:hypothetical protein
LLRGAAYDLRHREAQQRRNARDILELLSREVHRREDEHEPPRRLDLLRHLHPLPPHHHVRAPEQLVQDQQRVDRPHLGRLPHVIRAVVRAVRILPHHRVEVSERAHLTRRLRVRELRGNPRI